jgi:hypothetical protein
MLGKLLSIGPLLGIAYLAIIMWWLTGYTPVDLINVMVDTINQPLSCVIEALK